MYIMGMNPPTTLSFTLPHWVCQKLGPYPTSTKAVGPLFDKMTEPTEEAARAAPTEPTELVKLTEEVEEAALTEETEEDEKAGDIPLADALIMRDKTVSRNIFAEISATDKGIDSFFDSMRALIATAVYRYNFRDGKHKALITRDTPLLRTLEIFEQQTTNDSGTERELSLEAEVFKLEGKYEEFRKFGVDVLSAFYHLDLVFQEDALEQGIYARVNAQKVRQMNNEYGRHIVA